MITSPRDALTSRLRFHWRLSNLSLVRSHLSPLDIFIYLLVLVSLTFAHLLRSTDLSQLVIAPRSATHTTVHMPRQKMIRSGKGRKKSAGGPRIKKDLPRSDEAFTGPTPRLTLTWKNRAADLRAESVTPSPNIDLGEHYGNVVEQLPVQTTRSGRPTKARKDDDYLYEDEYNNLLASSPPQKASHEGSDLDYQFGGSPSTRK